MHRLLLASSNPGKIEIYRVLLQEVAQVLDLEIEILIPNDLGLADLEVVEEGSTCTENAYLKAKAYWEALPNSSKIPCLAIDNSIFLEGVEDVERLIAGEGDGARLTADDLHTMEPGRHLGHIGGEERELEARRRGKLRR